MNKKYMLICTCFTIIIILVISTLFLFNFKNNNLISGEIVSIECEKNPFIYNNAYYNYVDICYIDNNITDGVTIGFPIVVGIKSPYNFERILGYVVGLPSVGDNVKIYYETLEGFNLLDKYNKVLLEIEYIN